MATEIGKGVIPVTFDKNQIGRDLSSSIDQGARQSEGAISSTFKRIAAIATAAVAGAKVLSFVEDSVAAARESNKVLAQTTAVIASTGGAANVTAGHVDQLANAIARQTGIQDEQIASSEDMLLTFTNIANVVGKGNDVFDQATKAVVDMSVAMKTDQRSAAILVGKALNDPIKGLMALTRVGVEFTKQQQDQIKTLVASGHTLDAQKLILGELNREFGGSAVAVATAGERLAVVWDNLKEDIGNKVIPALDFVESFLADRIPGAATATFSALTRLSKTVTGVAGEVRAIFTAVDPPASLVVDLGKLVGLQEDAPGVAALAGAFDRVASALSGIGDLASRLAAPLTGKLHDAVASSTIDLRGYADTGLQYVADTINVTLDFLDKLAGKLEANRVILEPLAAGAASFVIALLAINKAEGAFSAVQTGLNALGAILPAILAAIGGPITLIVAAIVAVGVGLVFAYLKVKPFHDAVNAVARFIADKAVATFERLRDITSTVADAFSTAAKVIGDRLSAWGAAAASAYNSIVTALTPLGQWINDNVIATLVAAGGFFSILFERIMQVVTPVVNDVLQALRIAVTIITTALEILAPVAMTVLSGIATLFADFATIAMPILTTAFQVLEIVVETVFGYIRMVIETVLGVIRGLFQVAEGVLRGDFSKIWEGLETIVETPLNAAWTFISNTFDNIVGLVTALPGRLAAVAGGLWDFLLDSFKTVINTVISIWNNMRIPSFEIGGWDTPFGSLPSYNTPEIDFPDLPTLNAVGGIFDQATLGWMGEAGREVLLPLTNPARTWELAGKSGLLDVLAKGIPHIDVPDMPAALGRAGGGTASGSTFNLTENGDVVMHEPGDMLAAFHRLELLAPR